MRFQFSIARLMLSTAFFAVAVWAMSQLWKGFNYSSTDAMLGAFMGYLIPLGICGSLIALFDKTPRVFSDPIVVFMIFVLAFMGTWFVGLYLEMI